MRPVSASSYDVERADLAGRPRDPVRGPLEAQRVGGDVAVASVEARGRPRARSGARRSRSAYDAAAARAGPTRCPGPGARAAPTAGSAPGPRRAGRAASTQPRVRPDVADDGAVGHRDERDRAEGRGLGVHGRDQGGDLLALGRVLGAERPAYDVDGRRPAPPAPRGGSRARSSGDATHEQDERGAAADGQHGRPHPPAASRGRSVWPAAARPAGPAPSRAPAARRGC